MERRELLKSIALMTGAVFIGGEVFLQSGCKPVDRNNSLAITKEDFNLLNEIGETIIPSTNTPGAKAANIAQFMNDMVNDCYSDKDKKTFIDGLREIESEFKAKNGRSFLEATIEERTIFLNEKDKEAKEIITQNVGMKEEEKKTHYLTMMKQLTVLGYFTSEIGAKQTLRYIAVPGKYDGAMPYKKGDKAWAS